VELYFSATLHISSVQQKRCCGNINSLRENFPRSALTFDDFAVIRVNWEPKSKNVSEICGSTPKRVVKVANYHLLLITLRDYFVYVRDLIHEQVRKLAHRSFQEARVCSAYTFRSVAPTSADRILAKIMSDGRYWQT
jgi:hypothetical protein